MGEGERTLARRQALVRSDRISVAALAQGLGAEVDGDGGLQVARPAPPSEAAEGDIALAMSREFLDQLPSSAAQAAIIPADADWRALGLKAAIRCARPRSALSVVTQAFEAPRLAPPGAHPTALIDPEADIDPSAHIGPFCIIGPGARLGAGAALLGHCSVGGGADIGPGSLLFAGARVGAGVRLGARCVVHENAVIGADGFSFATPEKGSVESARESGAVEEGARSTHWLRIASLGSVWIGDDCDIGANTTIDRGTVVDTRLGDGVKVDNQVQIGHNVRIGDNCLICGQVGIAGSSVIGARVVLGGQAGIADHSKIGDDVVVMAAAGVSGVLPPRSVVGGSPAVPRAQLTEMFLQMRRLPRLARDLAALKKRFSSEEASG